MGLKCRYPLVLRKRESWGKGVCILKTCESRPKYFAFQIFVALIYLFVLFLLTPFSNDVTTFILLSPTEYREWNPGLTAVNGRTPTGFHRARISPTGSTLLFSPFPPARPQLNIFCHHQTLLEQKSHFN